MRKLIAAVILKMFMKSKTSYDTFEEWRADLERVRSAPDDKHLIIYVTKRVEASSDDIKKQVKEYLMNATLELNPWLVFEQVAKENPSYKVMVRSKDDPWFSV